VKPPRSIFRCHQRPWLSPVLAAIAKHRDRFRPGTLTEVRTWHAPKCPHPRGRGECSCRPDEIEVEVVDPERN